MRLEGVFDTLCAQSKGYECSLWRGTGLQREWSFERSMEDFEIYLWYNLCVRRDWGIKSANNEL